MNVGLRIGDFSRVSRSCTLAAATDSTAVIHRRALELVESVLDHRDEGCSRTVLGERGLTLVSLSISGLGSPATEYLTRALDGDHSGSAVDQVGERFGTAAIRAGSLQPSDRTTTALVPAGC